MNSLFKIPGISFKSFFLGFASGFLAALISPKFGESYYAFCVKQAEQLGSVYSVTGGDLSLTLTIYLRNFSITLLIAIFPLALIYQTFAYRKRHPFKSGDFAQKLKSEMHLTLTMYSISILFAYGFAVFGLFLASIFAESSFQGLAWWSVYLIPHGILETSCMISAASTAIVIRDNWLKSFNPRIQSPWSQIPKRNYAEYLVLLSTLLLLSAFLEVYVSRGLVQLVFDKARF